MITEAFSTFQAAAGLISFTFRDLKLVAAERESLCLLLFCL